MPTHKNRRKNGSNDSSWIQNFQCRGFIDFYYYYILVGFFSKNFHFKVLFREDCTADELIDVISANRVYLPCLYVYNKIDQISIEEIDRIARQPNSVVVRYY